MKKILISSALFISLLPLCAVYHKLGDYCDLPSNVNSFLVVGDIAYLTDSHSINYETHGSLKILDISDPGNPQVLSTYPTYGAALSVVVTGSIAYLGERSALQVLDVSNPQNPYSIGSLYLNEMTYVEELYTVADSLAYITIGGSYPRGGCSIYDVSDPEDIIYLGLISTPGETGSITVAGSIAYVADGSSGLQIMDVSNPQIPSPLGSYDTPGLAEYVTVVDNTAYIADGSSGLQIIDVSNPQNPILIGSYDTPGAACHVSIRGTTACVADSSYGVQVIDVSNPQSPSLIGYYDIVGDARFVSSADNIAWVSDGGFGLQIIDISDPQNTSLLGFYDTPGQAHCVAIAGNTAYVADGESGLQIVDISNPQNPTLLGSYITPWEANSVDCEGNTVYLLTDYNLQAIDVSNPQNPALLESFWTASASSVKVVDDVAYVAYWSGLLLLDVSDPQHPAILGYCHLPGEALSVAVSADAAYIAAGDSGLLVIDISNPHNPSLLGALDTPGLAQSVAVSGCVAYIADGDAGMQLIDITDASSPFLISTIQPLATRDINLCYTDNNYLLAADAGWNEIRYYNISTPQTPFYIDSYAWNLKTEDMLVANEVFYTANGRFGLNVHDLAAVYVNDPVQIPLSTFQMRNYPNPFNPETTISYTLSSAGSVSLDIYNSRGQLVRSLLQEVQSAGEHPLIWNGKDDSGTGVASGLYLCRIACNGKQETRKLLLLK